MGLIEWAQATAEEYLAPLARRWAHSEGVARQAERLQALVGGEDRDALVAAAYLHDVGYAPDLVATGFHPIDGARHLRTLNHGRLASLVAYHGAALEEAELRDLASE
ncbi:MAG: HD domain-containing protein, partial [Acidimicrobiales bacterium]